MKKEQVLAKLRSCGLVAVVRAKDADDAMRIAEACIEGGCAGIELTYTTPGVNAIIEKMAREYDGTDFVIGAGTVMDPETARMAILSGAQYVVSPYFNGDTVRLCNRYRVACMPGAMSIAEVVAGMEAGADIIKVFPGELFGPKILKSIHGPIPQAELMPTGGVSLDNVAEWICEVDRGHLYPYKGNYTTYLETKAARLASQKQRDERLAKRLSEELEWVRSSPKARQAKSRARLERYDQMVAEAAQSKKVDFTEIHIPAGPRLGANVLKVDGLCKSFGDRVLIDNLSFELPRNGIVGVIGPNGVGKSTLFKMIVGKEQPTSGTLELGETVKLSYVDQGREGIDPKKNVWEVVSDGLDYMMVCETEVPSRAYVASFGFKGSDQQKPAGVLSGGERNRLNLALTLKQGGNLLLLDEPTNDLDVETLSSLEEALLEFPGCAVVTSHDRMFLDRIATHILAWEGTDENPGNWFWFEGNFDSYQKNRIERLGEEASKPHRLHRKLTRN